MDVDSEIIPQLEARTKTEILDNKIAEESSTNPESSNEKVNVESSEKNLLEDEKATETKPECLKPEETKNTYNTECDPNKARGEESSMLDGPADNTPTVVNVIISDSTDENSLYVIDKSGAPNVGMMNYRGDSSSDSESSIALSHSDLDEDPDDFQQKPSLTKTQIKKMRDLIRTHKEIFPDELPMIEDLHITVDETEELILAGKVTGIVDILVVIQCEKDTPTLNEDTVLFKEDRQVFGKIFEVFGPVALPNYSVRFNSAEDIKERGIVIGQSLYCAPRKEEYTQYVFMDQLKKVKGSDASWFDNQEPPAQLIEYSDDEEEKMAKAMAKIERRNRAIQRCQENGEQEPKPKNKRPPKHKRKAMERAALQASQEKGAETANDKDSERTSKDHPRDKQKGGMCFPPNLSQATWKHKPPAPGWGSTGHQSTVFSPWRTAEVHQRQSFPPGQQNQAFPPGPQNQQFPPGQQNQQFPPGQQNQQFPPGPQNQQFPPGQQLQQFPPGQQLQQFPPGQQNQAFPPGQQNQQFPPGQQNQQFPPGQQNQAFPPGQQLQQFPPGQQNQQFPPGQQNQQFPPGQQNQQFPPGQQNQQFPPGQQNQQFPPGQQNQQFPPSQSNQVFSHGQSSHGYPHGNQGQMVSNYPSFSPGPGQQFSGPPQFQSGPNHNGSPRIPYSQGTVFGGTNLPNFNSPQAFPRMNYFPGFPVSSAAPNPFGTQTTPSYAFSNGTNPFEPYQGTPLGNQGQNQTNSEGFNGQVLDTRFVKNQNNTTG